MNTRVELFVAWQANSCLRQDKENSVLWLRPPPIKSRECEDPSWVGFWVFSCANLDYVQKFLDWHLKYFFLSTNVCCNTIWTLEIILSQDLYFNQNSTKFKLAQNKTKSKEQKELKFKSYPRSYVFNKRLFHMTKSFLQTQLLN